MEKQDAQKTPPPWREITDPHTVLSVAIAAGLPHEAIPGPRPGEVRIRLACRAAVLTDGSMFRIFRGPLSPFN